MSEGFALTKIKTNLTICTWEYRMLYFPFFVDDIEKKITIYSVA